VKQSDGFRQTTITDMAAKTDENKYKIVAQGSVAIIGFFVLWEVAARLSWIDTTFVPPFTTVVGALWDLLVTGKLARHLSFSFMRAGTGFGAALLLGIPLGFLVGWFRTFDRFVNPLLQMIRQLPTLALFPVFMLLFGIGELSKILIITKACFWPIFLNTAAAVGTIEPLLIKAARSMKISSFGMFRKVVLPAALPSIFAGLRLSATAALLTLVAAEMLGANAGIGFLIFNSEAKFEIPEMYAGILFITMLGIATNYGLLAVEKHVSKWKQEIAS